MSRKRVLVLGAGLVARPHVRYLLAQPEFEVIVASRTVSKAVSLVDGHPRGEARKLDLTDPGELARMIPETDLVISLVPYAFHVRVAELCIRHRKLMITTSYVSEPMRALDGQAKDAGILILNEIGLDPGIDHMSATRVFLDVKARGGTIDQFRSYCGGLPSPEADTNPYGYKFSWSPKGVLLAGKNSARYRKDGVIRAIASKDLFLDRWTVHVDGVGDFESYPNRDSVSYIDTYSLQDAATVIRATLRKEGWCESIKAIIDLGFLGEEEADLEGMTYIRFLDRLAGGGDGDVREKVAGVAGIGVDSNPMKKMEWLGLFAEEKIPLEKGAPIDVLTHRMLDRMSYAEGERDMIVLYHEFEAKFPDGRREQITSTLVDHGIPYGDSAMSRTVGLPAAIAARFMLDGTIKGSGVKIPVDPAIYEPIMEELENLGISCEEKTISKQGE